MAKKHALSLLKKIPGSIWALGLVSLFMDASSELIHSLLPVFMTSVLGLSMTYVGMIEGIAEALAQILKIFSGTFSDYLGKRKLPTLLGYSLSALTKILFPLANSLSTVFTARLLDRAGKGIRDAPRDALIGELAPKNLRGASFGLRQSLDTLGAIIGPLLAVIFLWLFSGNIRMTLWIATIPAALSVLTLYIGVKEPNSKKHISKTFHLSAVFSIDKSFWILVIFGAILSLARFSEAFLILKAQVEGIPIVLVPFVLIVMNIAYVFSAYPAGLISDRYGRKPVLLLGIFLLALADGLLAEAEKGWVLGIGIALWGVHLGLTQGILAALVTDTTRDHYRGTAYGIFHMVSGLAMIPSSLLAGFLWDHYGAAATFYTGAAFALLALTGLALHTFKPVPTK